MSEAAKPLVKIEYYKTNIGIFLKLPKFDFSYTANPYIVNDMTLVDLPIMNGFFYMKDHFSIDSVKEKKQKSTKRIGYKITDETLISDRFPAFLSNEDVGLYYDDDTGYCWKNYDTIRSLYVEEYEVIPETIDEVDFETVLIRELVIDEFESPKNMKVRMADSGSFTDEIYEVDLRSIVRYDEIEKMLTPEFLLDQRPCSLTSAQVYQIVRAYIKEHISPEARITSDYNFCFTVKKVLHIKPIRYKKELFTSQGRRYKPPRFTTKTKEEELYTIFEMTYKGQGGNYQSYTPIEPWSANSLQELQENMERYLNELMDTINCRVVQCEHCQGTGAIVSKIPTNERERYK